MKTPCLFKCPKSCCRCFYSYRFLRWWALCTRNCDFPAFCGCESLLGRKSCFLFLSSSFHVSFMFLSCFFHVSFMFLSYSLIWHSCPFIFRRYLSNIQVFEGGIFKPVRWVSAQTLAFSSYYVVIVLVIGLPSSGIISTYMYKFVIVFFFTLLIFWAGNALVVLRGKSS